ncbi:hypothetical protein M3I54_29800 [Paraburkholderia sp. CNPSo 3274]|uniref:hypothetical protein n=1 Tax=Paraburkholderia sp. CNPSo 3274 TaxID=2940932 RepID=UPI0020B64C08|nr:hypothetical protein [Paraburkholderia sp. CNPSo 3274]MCP3711122.1 hypothetical protein [Paraburkholderia sp. CNPSo 3274]
MTVDANSVWQRIVRAGACQAVVSGLLADYDLSPATSVYAEADYSLYRGGMVGAQLQGFVGLSAAATTTQLGMMVGLRQMF